ncbi:MAG TPA: hypothetical protein VNN25_21435 [Thermoanaerobaculia bacterium]|nr:hypothetical protein [Thermoanaerobaculia bacterium]
MRRGESKACAQDSDLFRSGSPSDRLGNSLPSRNRQGQVDTLGSFGSVEDELDIVNQNLVVVDQNLEFFIQNLDVDNQNLAVDDQNLVVDNQNLVVDDQNLDDADDKIGGKDTPNQSVGPCNGSIWTAYRGR